MYIPIFEASLNINCLLLYHPPNTEILLWENLRIYNSCHTHYIKHNEGWCFFPRKYIIGSYGFAPWFQKFLTFLPLYSTLKRVEADFWLMSFWNPWKKLRRKCLVKTLQKLRHRKSGETKFRSQSVFVILGLETKL